jgi:hypothetical protein
MHIQLTANRAPATLIRRLTPLDQQVVATCVAQKDQHTDFEGKLGRHIDEGFNLLAWSKAFVGCWPVWRRAVYL